MKIENWALRGDSICNQAGQKHIYSFITALLLCFVPRMALYRLGITKSSPKEIRIYQGRIDFNNSNIFRYIESVFVYVCFRFSSLGLIKTIFFINPLKRIKRYRISSFYLPLSNSQCRQMGAAAEDALGCRGVFAYVWQCMQAAGVKDAVLKGFSLYFLLIFFIHDSRTGAAAGKPETRRGALVVIRGDNLVAMGINGLLTTFFIGFNLHILLIIESNTGAAAGYALPRRGSLLCRWWNRQACSLHGIKE
jgi:hypothetical protein